MDINEALAGARLPEKLVPICLRGDLQADFEALEKQLDLAMRGRGDSLAAGTSVNQLAEQLEALRAEMEAQTVVFRMRAVTRRRWTDLTASHPPRDDNNTDRVMGVNESTFSSALIEACTVDPVLTHEQWETLFDERLTEFQFQKLFGMWMSLSRTPPQRF
jgi:hypothetical protein